MGMSRRWRSHALDLARAQDFLEEHALVGDVLIDDPQSFVVDGENERLAHLAEGLERCAATPASAECVLVFNGEGSASVIMSYTRNDFGSAPQRDSRIAVDLQFLLQIPEALVIGAEPVPGGRRSAPPVRPVGRRGRPSPPSAAGAPGVSAALAVGWALISRKLRHRTRLHRAPRAPSRARSRA